MICRKMLVLVLTAGMVLFGSYQARAGNFFDEVWGVVTDPLKLGKSTARLQATLERLDVILNEFEGRLNADVRDRIDQVDKAVAAQIVGAKDATEEIIDKVFNEIAELEQTVMADASRLIECSVYKSTYEMKSTLAELLNKLGKSNPRFIIFGVPIGRVAITEQDIPDPLTGYIRTKDALLESLIKIGATDHAQRFVIAYGEIIRLSNLTRCHYVKEKGAADEALSFDFWEFKRRSKAWAGYVRLGKVGD